ncbi:MAG: helix-turn-helix transcriptional regulator [Proteobacteria bacterium]|nr:helix-turn-helix transcriptional regulator [Pseudomonadota bacterium]
MSKPEWASIILQIMNEAGISQRELSRRTGVGRSVIRRFMSGKVSPTLADLEMILDVFGYDIDAIPRPQTLQSIAKSEATDAG